MPDPTKPDYVGRASDEIKGIAKEGLSHPGAKPMLTGIAIGAVAAILLPVLTLPVGIIGGAGIALWQRIKR